MASYSSKCGRQIIMVGFPKTRTFRIINRFAGIRLPSRNPAVLSLVENYLPTVFATLLEPAWVLLNRMLCLLQPFDKLRRGNAEASASVKARYTSLPPQLVVWRAFRSGHILLAAVCVVALSTNILAVTLSAIIEERSTNLSLIHI